MIEISRGTHSDFVEKIVQPASIEQFAQQIAAIYNGFAERQRRLGPEFEASGNAVENHFTDAGNMVTVGEAVGLCRKTCSGGQSSQRAVKRTFPLDAFLKL